MLKLIFRRRFETGTDFAGVVLKRLRMSMDMMHYAANRLFAS